MLLENGTTTIVLIFSLNIVWIPAVVVCTSYTVIIHRPPVSPISLLFLVYPHVDIYIYCVGVQCDGGSLPDIMLYTLCYYRGTLHKIPRGVFVRISRCMYGHHISSSSSSSSPLYCLRENISFDTLIRRSSRGHNSRKATQPSHCGTCLILLIFIAKRVQPSLPSSTLGSNFVYPRQISRSPRVGHCMS